MIFVFDVVLPICAVILILWVGWTVLRPVRPAKSNAPASAWPGLRDLESGPPVDHYDPTPYQVTRRARAGAPPSPAQRRRQDEFFYGLPEPLSFEGRSTLTEDDFRAAAYKSGMGGDFAGGGASGDWDNEPAPAPYRSAVNVPWVSPVADVGVCRSDEPAPLAAVYAFPSPSPAPAPYEPPAPAPEPSPSPSPSYGD